MSNKETVMVIILIAISMLIGCFWEKSYLDKNRPLVSERLELCESLGGKYQYYWYDSWNRYVEQCEVIPPYIDLDK